MKHTPGPWKVQNKHRPELFTLTIWDQIGRLIATTSSKSPMDKRTGSPSTKEAIKANAALIAAAPDMLEALRAVLGLAYQWGPRDAGEYKTIINAEAAIAKATE